MGDVFGLAELRAGVLEAWRGSPTRLREDAATEADLVRAGYRDRLLTELAQNAADAAVRAEVPGRLAVWFEDRTLHVANTGVPLDISGVHALTALRASAKSGAGASVGRFGVGFTAVLTAGDEIEFRSSTGAVLFSRERTRDELRGNGIAVPDDPEFAPPALRLAWPLGAAPAAGFDSEIVLHLREDVDIEALSDAMRAAATDLLLELPALTRIRIGENEIASASTELGGGLRRLRVSGPEFGERIWWQFETAHARWLLPVDDGRPVAAGHDVLRAPTRSDEELSLPALLIARIAMQPDRRRLLPGARITELASGYADFARALPPRDRLILVPAPGFARSETDSLLREALVAELRTEAWLPVVPVPRGRHFERGFPAIDAAAISDSATSGADVGNPDPVTVPPGSAVAGSGANALAGAGTEPDAAVADSLIDPAAPNPVSADTLGDAPDSGALDDRYPGVALAAPARASVFTGVTTELADLLADLLGPLVIPELSGRTSSDALTVLDVHRIGLARTAELSSSLERPPQWWYSLYDALEPFVVDPLAAEELGALAVPLADGRRVTGPRTVVLGDELELLEMSPEDDLGPETALPVHWARLVHPEAAHELLSRLGARQATVADLLADPALEAALQDDPADPDTVDAVLRLAGQPADTSALPAWLGMLELPAADGELLPADELLLPGAPLAAVLAPDSPFGTVDSATLDRYGEQALRAIGVGWGFSVVTESDPTGPDHHLDDEETWWEGLPEDPPELIAVRDLDLVDDDAWPDALRLLLSEPRIRRCLADRDGYTTWWLRRHARIGGIPLGLFRAPGDEVFAGLLPAPAELDPPDIASLRAVLADPDTITPDLADALLDALADPAKMPSPEAISQTHRRLAAALDRLGLDELALPERVRALSGEVIDPAGALVLDEPCYGLAVPPDRLVVSDRATAPALATLLDLPLVSEAVTAEVLGAGRPSTWRDEPLGVVLRLQFGLSPAGPLILHENLRVRLGGAYEATVEVPWWREGEVTHVRAQPIARRS